MSGIGGKEREKRRERDNIVSVADGGNTCAGEWE
jgi:hypothetical protein